MVQLIQKLLYLGVEELGVRGGGQRLKTLKTVDHQNIFLQVRVGDLILLACLYDLVDVDLRSLKVHFIPIPIVSQSISIVPPRGLDRYWLVVYIEFKLSLQEILRSNILECET